MGKITVGELIALLDFLDGAGIIFTDEELVMQELKVHSHDDVIDVKDYI
jgi:hypothetical protein